MLLPILHYQSCMAVRTVMLIIAMEEEAMPIVRHHNLKRVDAWSVDGAPMIAWIGDVDSVNLTLIWCGFDERFGVNNVATTAAAVSTYAAVAAFGKPDLILSVGTAGGFGCRGASIGDVFLSTKYDFCDRVPTARRLSVASIYS